MPRSAPFEKKPLPTQPRALVTRARLIEAGRRAFAELGHDAVNLERDVLEPAGVNVGSFYYQFNDKTELLLAVLESSATAVSELVMAKGFLDPGVTDLGERIELGVARLFESFDAEDHGWRVSLRVHENTNPRIREFVAAGRGRWIDHFATLIRSSTGGSDDAAALTAGLVISLIVGAASMYLGLDDEERIQRRPQIAAEVTRFLLAGLQPAE